MNVPGGRATLSGDPPPLTRSRAALPRRPGIPISNGSARRSSRQKCVRRSVWWTTLRPRRCSGFPSRSRFRGQGGEGA
jgi:hypothetical protein